MTPDTVIEEARQMVHDEGSETEAQTWGDEQWAIALDAGTRYIFHHCAESRLATAGTISTWAAVDLDNPQTALCIDDVYQEALVEFMVSRYYMADSGDTRDEGLADKHYNKFLMLTSAKPQQ